MCDQEKLNSQGVENTPVASPGNPLPYYTDKATGPDWADPIIETYGDYVLNGLRRLHLSEWLDEILPESTRQFMSDRGLRTAKNFKESLRLKLQTLMSQIDRQKTMIEESREAVEDKNDALKRKERTIKDLGNQVSMHQRDKDVWKEHAGYWQGKYESLKGTADTVARDVAGKLLAEKDAIIADLRNQLACAERDKKAMREAVEVARNKAEDYRQQRDNQSTSYIRAHEENKQLKEQNGILLRDINWLNSDISLKEKRLGQAYEGKEKLNAEITQLKREHLQMMEGAKQDNATASTIISELNLDLEAQQIRNGELCTGLTDLQTRLVVLEQELDRHREAVHVIKNDGTRIQGKTPMPDLASKILIGANNIGQWRRKLIEFSKSEDSRYIPAGMYQTIIQYQRTIHEFCDAVRDVTLQLTREHNKAIRDENEAVIDRNESESRRVQEAQKYKAELERKDVRIEKLESTVMDAASFIVNEVPAMSRIPSVVHEAMRITQRKAAQYEADKKASSK